MEEAYIVSGNGVVAAGTPRVAPSDPPETQPTTLHQAVTLHGLQGVLGTRRRVPTRGWHPCEPFLVATDQEDADFCAHIRIASATAVSTSPRRASNGTSVASCDATSTRSHSESQPFSRCASFNRRLTRFRWGFEPILREVAMPKRPVPGRIAARTQTPLPLAPLLKIASKRALVGPLWVAAFALTPSSPEGRGSKIVTR